jgi:hypothetical protein
VERPVSEAGARREIGRLRSASRSSQVELVVHAKVPGPIFNALLVLLFFYQMRMSVSNYPSAASLGTNWRLSFAVEAQSGGSRNRPLLLPVSASKDARVVALREHHLLKLRSSQSFVP